MKDINKDIENLEKIINLINKELDKKDKNVSAILDLKDLLSLRNLIKEYKELEEDLTSVYLKGVYDERDKWKIKVKKKIEEIIQNSSHFNMISPLNYDKEYYETRFAVDKLQELLEESEK